MQGFFFWRGGGVFCWILYAREGVSIFLVNLRIKALNCLIEKINAARDFVYLNIMARVICLIRLVKDKFNSSENFCTIKEWFVKESITWTFLFLHKYDMYYTDWYSQIVNYNVLFKIFFDFYIYMFCNMHKMLQCAVRKFSFYMSLLKIYICIVQNISNILIFTFVLCINEF